MKRFFLTLLLFASMASVAAAQTELPDKDKAIFCFDVQVAKIRKSKLAQSIGKEIVDEIFKSAKLPLSLEKYDRISGLVGVPHSSKESAAMFKGPNFPFNGFVEIRMVDAESAKVLLLGEADKNSSQIVDGVEYFNIPSRENVVVGMTSETAFVIGTKNYVFASDRKALFSDPLNKAWARRQANMPIRASLDVLSSADFFTEYVKMGARNDRMITALLNGWINRLESLNFAVDLSGEELLFLRGIGKSPTAAEDLRSDFNDIQSLQKSDLVKNSPTQTQENRKTTKKIMVAEMMNKMNTSGEGQEIDVVIGRPENLEAIIKEWITSEIIDK